MENIKLKNINTDNNMKTKLQISGVVRFLILMFTVHCTLFTALSLFNAVYAADTDGTATASFLKLEQGARAAGMGGAFTAMANDVECIWWNPAGAADLESPQFNVSYAKYIEDISGSYAAIAYPKGGGCYIGNVNYVSMGSIDSMNAAGAFVKAIDLSGMAISAGYSFHITSRMSIGFALKNIQQNLGDDTATGFGTDLGCRVGVSEALSLGVAVQNAGSNISTGGYENKLPMNIRGGLAYVMSPKMLVAVDTEKPSDSDSYTRVGTELKLSETFFVRAGYNTNKAAGMTFGAGILTPVNLKSGEGNDASWWKDAIEKDMKHNVVRIDYAYITTKYFDATHRVSITLKF